MMIVLRESGSTRVALSTDITRNGAKDEGCLDIALSERARTEIGVLELVVLEVGAPGDRPSDCLSG